MGAIIKKTKKKNKKKICSRWSQQYLPQLNNAFQIVFDIVLIFFYIDSPK